MLRIVVLGFCFSLNYFVSDVYEEDLGDSDTGSDSLRGSDDDGFLDTDDDEMISGNAYEFYPLVQAMSVTQYVTD